MKWHPEIPDSFRGRVVVGDARSLIAQLPDKSIDLPDMIEKFQPDAIRYYLSVNMPELRDTDFGWEDFVAKINNELVATYGNFVHRALSFTHKNFGEIPPVDRAPEDWKNEVDQRIEEAKKSYLESIEACNFKQGLKSFMDLAKFGNQFFDSAEPWALLRKDKERCAAALNLSLKIVRALAVLAYPYLPFSSERIWEHIGEKEPLEKSGWKALSEEFQPGITLSKPKPLFRKVELPGEEADPFSGFDRLNLKVGRIEKVLDHPKADKLYLLTVDIGRKITLVAGLRSDYSEQELLGKSIVVISNLEEAEIRGVRSEGMLLAAEKKSIVSLVVPAKEVQPGTAVHSGRGRSEEKISFEDFQKLEMVVGEVKGGEAHVGRRIKCDNCDSDGEGLKLALFLAGDRALALRCQDGTYMTVDRDIKSGAKIR